MQKKWMARQGDVLVVAAGRRPQKTVPRKLESGRAVLAHGEVTGHHHSFDASEGGVALLDEPVTGEVFLQVDRLSELQHQEHGTIEVAPGAYKVVKQVEYTPEAIRNVAD